MLAQHLLQEEDEVGLHSSDGKNLQGKSRSLENTKISIKTQLHIEFDHRDKWDSRLFVGVMKGLAITYSVLQWGGLVRLM